MEFFYSFFFFFFLVCAIFSFIYFSYRHSREESAAVSKQEAETLEVIVNSLFQSTHDLVVYIGKQIAKKEPHDLEYISRLFSYFSHVEFHNTRGMSATRIFWTDAHHNLVVHSQTGILEKPIDLSLLEGGGIVV